MVQWSEPLLSPWFVCPISITGLLLIGWHASSLRANELMPESRRRIRSVTNGIAAAGIPIITAGLCVIPPADQQLFAMVWMVAVFLLFVVVLLASMDVINTFRLHATERREHRLRLRRMRLEVEHILLAHERSSSHRR